MKQPKYASIFLAGALVFGGFTTAAPTAHAAVDTVAPSAPIVSSPLHTSTSLTIQGEVGAKAEIVINGKTYVRTVLANGEAIFKMSPQSVGKVIDVTLVDASNNKSDVTRVIVAEDPAARPAAPTIKPITNSSRSITVLGEPGNSLTLTIGGATYTGKFDANGEYRRGISLQQVGTPLTAQVKSSKGALSDLVKRSVWTDRYAPKPARVTQAVTAVSTGVFGTAEPFSTAIVTIGSKTYTAQVTSTGKFIVKIPRQVMGQKLSLVIRDGAGNKSTATALTVQHALYNNFHRTTIDGTRLTLQKEVFYSNGEARYAETFAPVFIGNASKSNLHFLVNYYAEDGMPIEFERLTLRVGSKTYSQAVSPKDLGYIEYDDGTLEESYFFKPSTAFVNFVRQNVRPENRIVVTMQGYEYDLEFALSGAEKRAFIQSLQYAGY